jgi:hypothetical protein
MPNVILPNGRRHYVNPFSMLCDCCERRVNCDWIEDRCRYECDACQRDVASQIEAAREEAEYIALQAQIDQAIQAAE